MRHMIIIASAVLMYSLSTWASCVDVISELRSMKEAQASTQNALISNHAMFATTLESYSEALTESAGKVHKLVSSNMSNSASSFRSRGIQARKTAIKLEEATEELILRIAKCIK